MREYKFKRIQCDADKPFPNQIKIPQTKQQQHEPTDQHNKKEKHNQLKTYKLFTCVHIGLLTTRTSARVKTLCRGFFVLSRELQWFLKGKRRFQMKYSCVLRERLWVFWFGCSWYRLYLFKWWMYLNRINARTIATAMEIYRQTKGIRKLFLFSKWFINLIRMILLVETRFSVDPKKRQHFRFFEKMRMTFLRCVFCAMAS